MNAVMLIHLVVTMCAVARRMNKYNLNSKYITQRRHDLRVYKGVPDTEHKHPYVVVVSYRLSPYCTGTAISSRWVLTAGHCLAPRKIQFIFYGNITYAWKLNARARVLKKIPHPLFRFIDFASMETDNADVLTRTTTYDFALMYTKVLPLARFASLLAVDYRALVGLAVEYAGYGSTNTSEDSNEPKDFPLQLGYGVLKKCERYDLEYVKGPIICVSSKCSNREQVTLGGDSGSSVFVDGKIVGVLYGGVDYPALSIYTAVSPHLTWIHNEMNKKIVITPKKNISSSH